MQANSLLKPIDKYATIKQEQQTERFLVDRSELEYEHNHLLARLHQLRRLLGYPPVMTGKKLRELE